MSSIQVGLVYVRGCEVEGMLDENGKVIEEGPEPKPKLTGDQRTWRVLLDCNQYQMDMSKTSRGGEVGPQEVRGRGGEQEVLCSLITTYCVHVCVLQDVYSTFNIFMRRRPKENNFKVSPWKPPLHALSSPTLPLPPHTACS